MHKGTAAKFTIALFAAALAADLVFAAMELSALRIGSKPLIVIALLAHFLVRTREVLSPLKYWVTGALVLSWLGDVLLLFEPYDVLFFLLGLSSFLLAHVGYIVFFHRLRRADRIAVKPMLVLPVLVYYMGLISLLYPHLGGLKLPVLVYGAVISTMLALALHLRAMKAKAAGALLIWGAALFVLSDSLLAVNKFGTPFTGAGALVMLTYGLAQFFIVRGSILALQKKTRKPARVREEEL